MVSAAGCTFDQQLLTVTVTKTPIHAIVSDTIWPKREQEMQGHRKDKFHIDNRYQCVQSVQRQNR